MKKEIRDILEPPLYLYQRTMWRIGQAKNELLKPLGFINEALLVLTYLTIKGQKITVIDAIIAYLVVLIGLAIAGDLLLRFGIVKYNQKLANDENPHLLEILETVKKIEQKL